MVLSFFSFLNKEERPEVWVPGLNTTFLVNEWESQCNFYMLWEEHKSHFGISQLDPILFLTSFFNFSLWNHRYSLDPNRGLLAL